MMNYIASFFFGNTETIRDQAIRCGLFAVIDPSDLTNRLFDTYGISFKDIKDHHTVFEGPMMDSPRITNKDFNLTVCEIRYSARCKLVAASDDKNAYDLVDGIKKLIRVQIHMNTGTGTGHSLKYQIYQQ